MERKLGLNVVLGGVKILKQFVDIIEGFEKIRKNGKRQEINGTYEKVCRVGSGRLSIKMTCEGIKNDEWQTLVRTLTDILSDPNSKLTFEFVKSVIKQNLDETGF